MTTIPLVPSLLAESSDLPGGSTDGPSAPACAGRPLIWSCSVRGFACHPCCHRRGALLPHLFTLTAGTTFRWCRHQRRGLPPDTRSEPGRRLGYGGIFSVPLSFELPRPGVTRRTAQRSSDFPLAFPSFGRFGKQALAESCPADDPTRPSLAGWPRRSPKGEGGRSSSLLRPSYLSVFKPRTESRDREGSLVACTH